MGNARCRGEQLIPWLSINLALSSLIYLYGGKWYFAGMTREDGFKTDPLSSTLFLKI